MTTNQDASQEPANETSRVSTGGGCGCLSGILIVAAAAILFVCIDTSDFQLMPGEADLSMEALQLTFDNIDQILPDSLMVDGELEPFDYYSQAQSFGNIYYGLNPAIPTMAKADTSRKYWFQYVARVDHVDAGEFVIHTMLVDSIWRSDLLGNGLLFGE